MTALGAVVVVSPHGKAQYFQRQSEFVKPHNIHREFYLSSSVHILVDKFWVLFNQSEELTKVSDVFAYVLLNGIDLLLKLCHLFFQFPVACALRQPTIKYLTSIDRSPNPTRDLGRER